MRYSAVLFDAYGTLFDVHSVAAMAEQLAPGRGSELSALWRQKQIEYTQLRTLGGRYKPFWEVTRDALDYANARLGLGLDEAQRDRLMNQYACLAAFPDVKPALKALRARGMALGILSNGTPQMLDIAVKSAGLTPLLDHVISIDAVRAYKTSPTAYALGPKTLGCRAGEILFVSGNGWDVAGAGWFGFGTFWCNRGGHPREQLDIAPSAEGSSLGEVAEFLAGHIR
ncbi:haloacid dehalogenase type II [Niveibacterium sp. 24ML]|uniref:haloacid dehalogenase type II n=1 Tax=Niveibacterium sp. 24ML TaxID=2985512 RepID=UPI00227174FE|nr:haloacid dehalogenase type II [Niveibacterium sp. 24ML]MCX9157132.1 haloacid dehalogenase type II [Niveibacterium sp. 24ML]